MMLNLEDKLLLKSYKYIRRAWINGRWRYWYEEPKGRPTSTRFGNVLNEYEGKPREAFARIYHDKGGIAENIAVLSLPTVYIDENSKIVEARDENSKRIYQPTPIDFAWGNKNVGLKHLLIDHYVKEDNFKSVKDAEQTVVRVLQKFQNDPTSFSVEFSDENDVFVLTSKEKERMVIAIEKSVDTKGNQIVRWFILTSFYRVKSKPIRGKLNKDRYNEIKNEKFY